MGRKLCFALLELQEKASGQRVMDASQVDTGTV